MRSGPPGNADNHGPTFHAMSVIPITLFFSLLLAGFFIALFLREQHRRNFSCPERDSLLPLAGESPRLAAAARTRADGGGGRPECTGGHGSGGAQRAGARADRSTSR